MSYEFTKLSGVPAVHEFPEGANAIIETNGEIKRCPSSNTPKPLTYDYMPEGYPSKSVQTTVLMEEQAVAFTEDKEVYAAVLTDAPSIVEGRTYTVNWDGTEYECVCSEFNNSLIIGNLSIMGAGEDSGEPFIYVSSMQTFVTLDTSPIHTISVTTTGEAVTPMAEEFLPASVAEIKATADNAKIAADNAKIAADNAKIAADNAKIAADNANNTASNALPLSGGEIQISSGGQVATLTLNEFTAAAGDAQKRGIQIGGSGAYGQPILEVTHDDITIYDSVAQRRIGGLNSNELFLRPKNSPKIFKITVDDSGTITATEVT